MKSSQLARNTQPWWGVKSSRLREGTPTQIQDSHLNSINDLAEELHRQDFAGDVIWDYGRQGKPSTLWATTSYEHSTPVTYLMWSPPFRLVQELSDVSNETTCFGDPLTPVTNFRLLEAFKSFNSATFIQNLLDDRYYMNYELKMQIIEQFGGYKSTDRIDASRALISTLHLIQTSADFLSIYAYLCESDGPPLLVMHDKLVRATGHSVQSLLSLFVPGTENLAERYAKPLLREVVMELLPQAQPVTEYARNLLERLSVRNLLEGLPDGQ